MSLSEFEFIDPFPKTFQILQTRVNLDHVEIAQWCRDTLAGFNGDYTSYHYRELNEHKLEHRAEWYRDFSEMAQNGARIFLQNLGVNPDHVYNGSFFVWWSVYKEGDKHVLHNHPKSLVAGTYYPHAGESSSVIRYRSPMCTLMAMADPRPEEESMYNLKPETGMMNFWSPWLDHEVIQQGPVAEGDERVAISFNYGQW